MNGFNVVNDWNESDEEMEEQEDEQDQEQEEVEEVPESEDDSDELDQPIDIEGDIADYVDECPVDINHFDIIKKLGSGAYGTVFLVRKNRGIDIDSIYALKVISKEEVMKVPKTIIHMRAERKALEILRDCPYIQTLYYAFQTGDKLHLVTEYVPGGEMFQQVQKGPQPEHLVQFYIAELIVALEHIHLKGIVYRDIKLENVLLDADGHIRLVDFGLCKKLGERGRSKSFCGTEEYMAPEVIEGIGHNTAADWWALGVLAIELLSTITPFGVNEENNTIMNRITNEEPIMPQDISEKMKDFLTKVLEKEPADRLGGSEASAAALKEHELFDGIDWRKLERKELPSPAEPPTITHPFDTQNFSREFTEQPATYASTEEPPNSFSIFRGYSYIAPELQPTEANNFGDDSTDENWNSMARHIISNRDPDSQFHQKYKFATHHPLGTGKSSVCMKCFNTLDNNYYAVKIYKRSDQNDNEIAILQKSSKDEVPGIVLLVEVLTDSKWTYLVMELIDGVNLMDYLSTIPLNGNVLYHAVIAVCDLVKVVHSKLKCTHGRICFKNIYYISESQELRLIGFGSANPKTGSQDEEIDYWAIGVFIYTILCGHSPFRSGVSVKQIENNKFDESSKQWSALPQSVKCLIQKLLRNCNSISKNDLKPLKKVHDISFDSSKERLDENKKIVEMRACKLETSPVIKTEMVSETNGNERITNGKMPAEDTVMPIDGSDEDPSQSPNIIPDESHTALNGQVQKTNFKRKSEKAEEIPKKKTKRDNAQSAPGEETKRGLRQRPRVDYAGKVKGAKTIEAVVIKKEPEPPLQNVTNTTRRGRPKKIAKSPTEPPKQRNPAVPQIRTANGTSTVKSLGEQARYNWVYGWRPKKVKKVVTYTFERFDYEK